MHLPASTFSWVQHSLIFYLNLRDSDWLFRLVVFRRVRKIAKSDNYVASSRLSVPLAHRLKQLGSHWMDIYEICIWNFFENLSRKLKFY